MKTLWALVFLSVVFMVPISGSASECTFKMHGKTIPHDEDARTPYTGPVLQGHYLQTCDLVSYDLRTNLGAQRGGADEVYVSTYLNQRLGDVRFQAAARYNFGSSLLETSDDKTRFFINASAPFTIGSAEVTPNVRVTRIMGIENIRNRTLAEARVDLSMEIARNITLLAHVRSSAEVSRTPVNFEASSTLSMKFTRNLSGEFSAQGSVEDGARGVFVFRYKLQE